MAGPLVFGRATVTVVAVDRRRSRRTALDFAQAIGVLSRQRVALEKIAKRLAAGGFSEAAQSVTDVGHRLTELAAAVNVEAEAAGEATAARWISSSATPETDRLGEIERRGPRPSLIHAN